MVETIMNPEASSVVPLIGRGLRQLTVEQSDGVDVKLQECLDQLEKSVERFLKVSLPEAFLFAHAELMNCCVQSREFIDWLHTKSMMGWKDGIQSFRDRFVALESKVREKGNELVSLLKEKPDQVTFSDRSTRYLRSIGKRKSLASKLQEELDIIEDLLEHDEEYLNQKKITPVSPSIEGIPNLTLINPTPEILCSLFFLWKGVRFLRHKVLFAAVELSHEAGPHLESVDDHLKINSQALKRASDFLRLVTSEEISQHHAAANRILQEFSWNVLAQLLGLKERRCPGFGPDKFVENELTSIGSSISGAFVNLSALELKLSGAVTKYLGTNVEVLESEAVGSLPPKSQLPSILEALMAGRTIAEFPFEQWMDRVLLEGWTFGREFDTPEHIALILFRGLVASDVRAASLYLYRFLDFPCSDSVLNEQVAAMFCGALQAAAEDGPRDRFPNWDEWLTQAIQLAKGNVGRVFSAAGRSAAAAGLISICICLLPPREEDSLKSGILKVERELQLQHLRETGTCDTFLFYHLGANLEEQLSSKSAIFEMLQEMAERSIPTFSLASPS